MHTSNILNIKLNNVNLEQLLQSFTEGILFTPNVDHLVKLQQDADFYNCYQQANWVICDSNIVQLGLKFLGNPVKAVIPGSSFFPAYYHYHQTNTAVKIFLLGAKPGVAHKAMEIINAKVQRTMVVDTFSPAFGFENNPQQNQEIIDRINRSGATILVVGLGAPKQEKWIIRYKDQLPQIKSFMALGATLDFEAGNIRRAPKLFQKLALEWLYRLIKEPGRLWKRYLVDDVPFFWLLLKQKSNRYRNPFENESA